MSTSVLTPSTLPQQLFNTPIGAARDGNNSSPVYVDSLVWQRIFQSFALVGAIPTALTGKHTDKASVSAANYPDGTLYFETDRGVYYVALHGAWLYLCGVMQTNQSAIPTDLGTADIGLRFNVLDYAHELIWMGSSWTWAPAENGSDYIVEFVSGPNPATGWQACDGSTVFKLNADGTITQVTVPNSAGKWYRQ